MVMTILASLYRLFADVVEIATESRKLRNEAAIRYPGLMASE